MKPPEGRFVKGNVIIDYVKMVRANPQLPWSNHLWPEDLEYLKQMILPGSWYPLAFFQRIGLAVFKLIGKENFAVARALGRAGADSLVANVPSLISPGKPRNTLEKFIMIQRGFYSFPAFNVEDRGRDEICVNIHSQPEEAIGVYIEQICGTVERLIERSGFPSSTIAVARSATPEDVITRLDIKWKQAAGPEA